MTDHSKPSSKSGVQQYDPTVIRPEDAVTLSQAARAHVERKLKARGSGIGLRLGIKKSGCTGYAYVIDFVDQAAEDDVCFVDAANPNIAVYVKQKHLPIVRGTRLDYEKQGLNHLFTFDNPNETASCGCGESFSVGDD